MSVLSDVDTVINNSDSFFIVEKIYMTAIDDAIYSAARRPGLTYPTRHQALKYSIQALQCMTAYNLVTHFGLDLNELKTLCKSDYVTNVVDNNQFDTFYTIGNKYQNLFMNGSYKNLLRYCDDQIVEFTTGPNSISEELSLGLKNDSDLHYSKHKIDEYTIYNGYKYTCSIYDILNMQLRSIVLRNTLSVNIVFSNLFYDEFIKKFNIAVASSLYTGIF